MQPATRHPKPGRAGKTLAVLLVLPFLLPVLAAVDVPANPDHAWQAPLAKRSLIIVADQAQNTLYAAGERGHVLNSSDGGKTWQQAAVPTQALLTGIDMLDGGQGWAVGHDAVILRTGDQGHTWEMQHLAPEEQRPLLDVRFFNEEHGIAVGAYGYYLETTDGGKRWNSRLIHPDHDFHLNAVSDQPGPVLYIAAEAGNVYRSRDRGANWTVLRPPYEGSFFDIAALEKDGVLVAGLRGKVFYSQDAGDSWQQVRSNVSASLNTIEIIDSRRFLVAGHSGVLMLGDVERGEMYLHRFDDRKAISDLILLQNNHVLVVGEFGARTANLCEIYSSELSGRCNGSAN